MICVILLLLIHVIYLGGLCAQPEVFGRLFYMFVCSLNMLVRFPIGNVTCALGTCALCYIGNCFGVVGLCRSGFDFGGGTSDLGR